MKIGSVVLLSIAVALGVTAVSVIIGILVAPGVFFTMGGGLVGVSWPPKTGRYVLLVFISHFFTSCAMGFFISLIKAKSHAKKS